MRTSRFISALTISALASLSLQAKTEEPKPEPARLFCGVAVQADLAGPVMKVLGTRFNNLECGVRLNFREKYFPIAELGIGESDREGQKTNTTFHARAPYFRLGMDYNLNKPHSGNRLFLGLRYGYSSFTYDYSDADFVDPVWGGAEGMNLTAQDSRMHWAEGCLGLETRLWSFVRLGWTLRYKLRLAQKTDERGEPYFTPGFGKNGTSTFGGTCNLVFDVGRTMKKQRQK